MILIPENHLFAFGESKYPNGGRFGPLYKSYFSLIIVKKGETDVICDDNTFTVREGQCAVIYNKHYVDYRRPAGVFSHILWCESGELTTSEDPSSYLQGLPKTLPTSERIETFWKLGEDLGHAGGLNRAILRNSIGRTIFYEYFEEADILETEEPLPRAVIRAKRYIDEHFCDKCNLDIVAEAVGISPPYLSKIFRQHLTLSPSQYLWELRITQGANLLRATGASISAIAHQCGYQTSHHFSRHVKQKYGCSPTDLRKREADHGLGPMSQVQEKIEEEQY